ncbi:MAG: 50S ribosomal protein L3 [Candidatus Aenigmatarchaeota archaeon]
MVKDYHPGRGARSFWPRKRAKRIYPVVSTYPASDKAKIMGFAGYKTAMTHAIIVDNKKTSLTSGQEISVPVTILECPPIKIAGFRAYKDTTNGLKILGEVWSKDLPKELERKVKIKTVKTEEMLKKLEPEINKIVKLRAIAVTQPKLAGIGKKTPEIFEIEIGGKDLKEKFEFAKNILGKEVKAAEIFKEGEFIDVSSVSKGKGMAGVVKRFGVRIQNRHARKKLRHIGTLGPQTPRKVRPTVPQAGQLGFQTRTELNKRVIKIGDDGKKITPSSGFHKYGVIKSDYIVLEGSVPGPKKRLIRFRPTIRAGKVKFLAPELKEIV